MLLNILRISAPNVLKTFLNIVNWYALLASRYPGRQDSSLMINKNDLETKLYMHNTKGGVELMNMSRETNYFHYFWWYPKYNFFAFQQPRYVLSMFLKCL